MTKSTMMLPMIILDNFILISRDICFVAIVFKYIELIQMNVSEKKKDKFCEIKDEKFKMIFCDERESHIFHVII